MFRRTAWIPLLTALMLGAAGCGDDNPAAPGSGDNGAGEGSELAGTWSVTRFDADGYDAIADGMTATIEFDVTGSAAPALRGVLGTYSVSFQNEKLGLCDGETDCTRTGPFDVVDGTIRFNPDTQDELVWTYQVEGSTMGMSTVADGVTLQVEAQLAVSR